MNEAFYGFELLLFKQFNACPEYWTKLKTTISKDLSLNQNSDHKSNDFEHDEQASIATHKWGFKIKIGLNVASVYICQCS